MAIHITDKMLSIPPYISTHWSKVEALHMKGGVLAISLVNGETVQIPGLPAETVHLIFEHHALFLEREQSVAPSLPETKLTNMLAQMEEPSAIHFAIGTPLDGLGSMNKHNPAQSNAPDLPPEVLQKISAISKILAPSDETVLPQAEHNCNCFHCQIARAINPSPALTIEDLEEVSLEELQFQQWAITQIGENLFSVANRLDDHEKYNVFLGHPVGCTCGQAGCEHILAVLKS